MKSYLSTVNRPRLLLKDKLNQRTTWPFRPRFRFLCNLSCHLKEKTLAFLIDESSRFSLASLKAKIESRNNTILPVHLLIWPCPASLLGSHTSHDIQQYGKSYSSES